MGDRKRKREKALQHTKKNPRCCSLPPSPLMFWGDGKEEATNFPNSGGEREKERERERESAFTH